MEIGRVIDDEEDCLKIQQDIDQLESWVDGWHVEINTDQCEVSQFEKSNSGGTCGINRRDKSIYVWRELGVQVYSLLKVVTHVDDVIKKAFNKFAFIG